MNPRTALRRRRPGGPHRHWFDHRAGSWDRSKRTRASRRGVTIGRLKCAAGDTWVLHSAGRARPQTCTLACSAAAALARPVMVVWCTRARQRIPVPVRSACGGGGGFNGEQPISGAPHRSCTRRSMRPIPNATHHCPQRRRRSDPTSQASSRNGVAANEGLQFQFPSKQSAYISVEWLLSTRHSRPSPVAV